MSFTCLSESSLLVSSLCSVATTGLCSVTAAALCCVGSADKTCSVAVSFALSVVLPQASPIGGGGFMMIHDANTNTNHALDYREMAPRKATEEMFIVDGEVDRELALYSYLSSGVPSTAVYFVSPLLIALIAAFFIFSGVSKSGSPAPKAITSFPAALNSLAF